MNRQSGIALILSIFILGFLSFLTIQVLTLSRQNVSMTQTRKDSAISDTYADAALQVVLHILREDDDSIDYLGERWSSLPPITRDQTTVSVTLTDENSKFNLNSLFLPDGTENTRRVAQFQRIFQNCKGNLNAIPAVLDWIDTDAVNRPGGFESGYYQQKKEPYQCKNANLDHLNELFSIEGMSALSEVCLDRLTITSDNLININTASYEMLLSLASDMTPALASSIIKYREQQPFDSVTDLKNIAGISRNLLEELLTLTCIRSHFFSASIQVRYSKCPQQVKVIVARRSGNVKPISYQKQYSIE